MTATTGDTDGMTGEPGDDSRLGRAGLAVTTLRQSADGIAYVALLLQRALTEISGATPKVVALDPARPGIVSMTEKLSFGARLAASEIAGSADWWLFNHVGIARMQMIVPRTVRRPYGVFLMGIEAWDPMLSDDRRHCLEQAQTLIAISRHTARRASEAHPELGPITACHLALLPDAAAPEPRDASLLHRVRSSSVLIVSRMSVVERYKGHDQLLECWPSVVENIPDAQLIVAGSGDDVARLQRKASELGVADNVLFAGFVDPDTLEHLWRRVAVFAMPSRGEGFGLVYLEAMRAGLPCVGSTVDAAAEIIEHERTGYLVDPDNRSQLASVILELLSNPARRTEMGSGGHARYQDQFSFPHFVDRLRPILISAFGRPARRQH